mmetsp:Transcript_15110/g.42953  ORF Transcript_15110/g.42953 Transcript_15110/m.42953 type:complete len:278 (-) Transcript_15110:2551-3384(-)
MIAFSFLSAWAVALLAATESFSEARSDSRCETCSRAFDKASRSVRSSLACDASLSPSSRDSWSRRAVAASSCPFRRSISTSLVERASSYSLESNLDIDSVRTATSSACRTFNCSILSCRAFMAAACVSSDAEVVMDAEIDSVSLYSRSARVDLSAATSAFSASFSDAMAKRRASSASSAASRETSSCASLSAWSAAAASWRARSSRNEHCVTNARRATVIRQIVWMSTAAASSHRRCRVARYRLRTTRARHIDWIRVAALLSLMICWHLLRAAYDRQ